MVRFPANAFAEISGLFGVPEGITTQSVAVGTPEGVQLLAYPQSLEVVPFQSLPILIVIVYEDVHPPALVIVKLPVYWLGAILAGIVIPVIVPAPATKAIVVVAWSAKPAV